MVDRPRRFLTFSRPPLLYTGDAHAYSGEGGGREGRRLFWRGKVVLFRSFGKRGRGRVRMRDSVVFFGALFLWFSEQV